MLPLAVAALATSDPSFRAPLIVVGFWFSVLLPFAPSAVLFVSCSIHRAEDKRIILELIRRVVFG